MGVVRRNRNFIDETRPQPFNRSKGSMIVRVAGDDYRFVERTNQRRNRPAGLKRKMMAAKWFINLKSNMPDANQDMFCVTNTKVNVPNILAISGDDLKMIIGDETA